MRARDEAGQVDCNLEERSATPLPPPDCIDYATMVQPIFDASCTRCHGGASPRQRLSLETHAGVLAGGLTGNEVVRCRPADSLLFQKISLSDPPVGVRMPYDGPPYLPASQITLIERWIAEGARASCAEADPCNDQAPPTFAGLTSATALDSTHARVCWSPGSDDATPASGLLYDVYTAAQPGGQDFGARPAATSSAGATCHELGALSPGSRSCFVVRARDQAGNRDANTVERCLNLPALPPGCVDHARHVQPLLDRYCTRCHSGDSPPQWLRLDSYRNIIAGSVRRNEVDACDVAGSLLLGKISPNPPLGARMPFDGPPYLDGGQIALLTQWVREGAQESCAQPAACNDTTAPSFGGIQTVRADSSTLLRACWNPASDGQTPASALRYDLWQATSPGGEDLAGAPEVTVTATTCALITAPPSTRLCVVARARDLAGNRSGNTQELCATTPAETCALEFAPHIQPILSARCTHCHDSTRPPRTLDLTSHGALLAGGVSRGEVHACNSAASLVVDKINGAWCGRRMPFDGPPWLSPAERALITTWIDQGARVSCADPDTCADGAPPTFAGLDRADVVDPTMVRLSWSAGTDDTSPAGQLSYDVFEAATAGSFSFNRPAAHVAKSGATQLDIRVAPGSTTCFVVRARDVYGRLDSNTQSRCATTPGACFPYQELVQPVFDTRCVHCHSGPGAPRGIRWDSYANAAQNREVSPCDPEGSDMLDETERCRMPRDTSADQCAAPVCLNLTELRLLREWVTTGAHDACPHGACP